jgi:phosphatidylglycerophosphate synthase
LQQKIVLSGKIRNTSIESGLARKDKAYPVNFRHLPNAISIARLMTVPFLIWLADAGLQPAFAWLLFAAGMSDVIDGWLARTFGWTSALGALLDSIADVLVVLVVIYGIWRLQPQVFIGEWPIFVAVLVIWSIVHVTAMVRYGRLASFHTRLTRIGLMLFGMFFLVLFYSGFTPWIFYLSAIPCFLGGVESLIMIFLVSEWTPDLRGGLVEVLRRRRQDGQ